MCLHDILNFSEGLAAVVKEMSGRNGEREGGMSGGREQSEVGG